MEMQRVWAIGLLVLATAGAAVPAPARSNAVKYKDKLLMGCPGLDCIPAFYHPQFLSIADAKFMENGDLVIGYAQGKEAKAYPHKILIAHEIVDDTVNGKAILVAYCPLCGTGMVFDRTVDGQVLNFGVSGRLLNSDLVMYDRESGTFWSQLLGEAITGPKTGKKLKLLPAYQGSWKQWKQAHPDTLVLKPGDEAATRFRNPYGDYDTNAEVKFPVEHEDNRYPVKEKMVGLHDGEKAVAFPFSELKAAGGVANHEFLKKKIVVFYSASDTSASVYERVAGGKVLRFERAGVARAFFKDKDTGSVWNPAGKCVEGSYKGQQLKAVAAVPSYWFAWIAFFPKTDVFTAPPR